MIPNNIQIADIIALKRKNLKNKNGSFNWWGLGVRFVTRSWFTHTAIYIGNGQIVESDWSCGVRIAPFPENEDYLVLTAPLTDKQRNGIVEWSISQVGREYSWTQLVMAALGLSKVGILTLYAGIICATFNALAYHKFGYDVVDDVVCTPGEIVNSERLEWIS